MGLHRVRIGCRGAERGIVKDTPGRKPVRMLSSDIPPRGTEMDVNKREFVWNIGV